MNRAKLVSGPAGTLLGAAAGMMAGRLFDRAWRSMAHEDRVPRATDLDRGWGEILLAAALQGAVFALVKAATDRASAQGARRLTGEWPQ